MFICWTSMLCKPSPSQICDFRTDEGVDTHCWNKTVKSNCCFNYRETLNISRSLYYAQYWPAVIILHTLTTPSTLVSLFFFFEEGAVCMNIQWRRGLTLFKTSLSNWTSGWTDSVNRVKLPILLFCFYFTVTQISQYWQTCRFRSCRNMDIVGPFSKCFCFLGHFLWLLFHFVCTEGDLFWGCFVRLWL